MKMRKKKKWQITLLSYPDCSRQVYISGFFDTAAKGDELKDVVLEDVIPGLMAEHGFDKPALWKSVIIVNLVCLG